MNPKMRQGFLFIFKKLSCVSQRAATVFFAFVLLNNTITVQWSPNSESDLAGYKVYYGIASRSYSRTIPVGLNTTCQISDLEPGYEYFFAVTAYDTAGNESQFSNEVSVLIVGSDDNLEIIDNVNVYNFPNPFNPEKQSTQIRYYLQNDENVTITIHDVGGNIIRTLLKKELKNRGEHIEDVWDGKDESGNYVANGIYYARVVSESLDHYITVAITK